MSQRVQGFRLAIYIFKDAEIVDFAAPYGVFSVARRFDPELDAFFVAESMRPVQAQAGFTVLPNYAFSDQPAMNAFLIPGGFGTRQELNNARLHDYIRSLPASCLITSVCTGSWIYGRMGLLDGLPASRKSRQHASSAAPGWSMLVGSSRPAGSRPGWRWDSTCCAAPAMTKLLSVRSPG
jgi:transcriptional regulator GlxA family with amidase domain